MNNFEEISIFHRFKNSHKNFPIGDIRKQECPDFIVEGEKIIGVEITQLFKDQDSPDGSLLKAKNSFQRHLLTNIVSKLKDINFPKCLLAIHLNDKLYSTSLHSRGISESWFEDILKKQCELRGNGYYEFENSGTLPEIIKGYTISIFDGIEEIEFAETGGAVGLALTNRDIQFLLNKKENAKINYTFCNAYWLLIKEGSCEADYFGVALIDNSTLETSFDKVFLLRQRNSEILELK